MVIISHTVIKVPWLLFAISDNIVNKKQPQNKWIHSTSFTFAFLIE
jgi:hypothetical protein